MEVVTLIDNEIEISPEAQRKNIGLFEDFLTTVPGAKFGDAACPLKHTFADGVYIREITMEKGLICTSKIHKKEHPYFVLQGDVTVVTETETVRIKAPHWGITTPGTKRVLYVHETTVWATVHRTNETDLAKIEDEIIAKDYAELSEPTTKKLNTEDTL